MGDTTVTTNPPSKSGSKTGATAAYEATAKSVSTPANNPVELRRTALHAEHLAAGARMVDFGGWDMPLSYRSQIEEHQSVRDHGGLFDVSHMTVLDLTSPESDGAVAKFLRHLLANDIARIPGVGGALYTCMLNQQGGVIDDLIAYRMAEDHFRLVVNASTRDKDLAWIEQHLPASVHLLVRDDLALMAIQGPAAIATLSQVLAASVEMAASEALIGRLESLQRFNSFELDGCWIARTGYTGEDGVELSVDASRAPRLWRCLLYTSPSPRDS